MLQQMISARFIAEHKAAGTVLLNRGAVRDAEYLKAKIEYHKKMIDKTEATLAKLQAGKR